MIRKLSPYHRLDSIKVTDHIANYFFVNLIVSRTTVENLKWKIGGDIIRLIFGKIVTSLVQKLYYVSSL